MTAVGVKPSKHLLNFKLQFVILIRVGVGDAGAAQAHRNIQFFSTYLFLYAFMLNFNIYVSKLHSTYVCLST